MTPSGSSLPAELADLVGRDGVLDRIRLAIVEVERSGQKATSRAVRPVAKVDANKIDRVLSAWRAGKMPPLDSPWEIRAEKPALVEGLESEIGAADTVAKLEAAGRKVTVEILKGSMDPRIGDMVLRGLAQQRQIMKMRMLERQIDSVASIEVLTPDEIALLEGHRAAKRPPPLKGGEAVAPP